MSLFLENEEKKSLVRLQLKEDERELGFGTKIYVPWKKDVLLVTSPSIFPDDIDGRLDDVMVHRCVARSWWSRKFKPQDPAAKVKDIENQRDSDVSTVEFEGGDKKKALPYGVLTKEEKKQHKKLCAFVIEDNKKIVLQFDKQGGSYKLSNVSKEGFDVKRAKGAPVIIEEITHYHMGVFPRGYRKIVGVLSIDSNGDLYPALFKDGFLDHESPSSSDTTEAGPSGIDTSESDSEKLKEAIKVTTQNQPKILEGYDVSRAKTDEIFTNLTLYYADKKLEKKEQGNERSREEHLMKYTKRTAGSVVTKFEDIFIPMTKDRSRENPEILLLTGKPGIGKTMFCEKVIRDWSMNRLFQNEDTPNIKFAYLLKFRQLNSLGDKELTLRELLNCSPLLDDNSVIDDSLIEYLTKNPSEVMIILDGFDEYSKNHQIASDFEERYPNDSRAKMPIPALFSKLIRGKVLRNSVVLVSSRPGEAEYLRKISVDRYVEISGFSPEQVTEYVDKYFSEPEKEQTKNTVRQHIEKNENLVSFCHIPLLSFLLCWCLEWRIIQSGITTNLPAKITELYDEVVEVCVQKLHAHLKYLKMSGNTRKIAQETMDKLSKLAAYLQKQSKFIFDQEDMEKQEFTEDEIENLKLSGILHCVPGIRISAFKTKTEFSFLHLTLQEYFSASFFVKNKEIPDKQQVSGQTFVFMSGCLSREKDGEQMEKLIQQVTSKDGYDYVNKLLTLQCLYEYREDELTKRTINNLYDKYCDSDGVIRFSRVTDVDTKCVSYLVDIIHSLKEQHPQPDYHYTLYISDSSLTLFGVGVVCDSLVRNSFITTLGLDNCSLDDNCVAKITDSLVNTGITYLDLHENNITDVGLYSICSVIIQDDCHVEWLFLSGNKKITEECKKDVKQLVQEHKPWVNIGYIDD